ncbi:MAG: NADH-quinone oxidoreductase subunit J [Acidobacteria bacterium]|nr:NADH-quinone oxidoreductase subunit J [Acidobacteriota bacterium]
MPAILFFATAALAVVAAFNVILQRNPIYSAIALIVVMMALAGVFLTLASPFIAAIQVIVYAGAIMVLFVFVIMLLNVRAEESITDKVKYLKFVAPALFIALLAEVGAIVGAIDAVAKPAISANTVADPSKVNGTVESIAQAMFTTYLLPFEATSVLILMAIVGSMLLAKRETPEEAKMAYDAARDYREQAD